MAIKDDLHRLVDELPQDELLTAKRYLEYLRNMSDPLLKTLMEAPMDDEPETAEEKAAVAEAYEDLAAGRVVTFEDIKREFGV